jgi:hypothetical protein
VADIIEFLVMDQTVDTVSLGETGGHALPVFPNPSREIVRHANGQGPFRRLARI